MDSLQVVQLFSIIASALFGISLPIFNSKAKTEQQKSRNATIAATGAAVGFLFSASSTIISNSIAKDSRSIQQAEKVLLKREKDSLSDVIRKIYLTADSAKSGISTANSKIAKSQETADSIIARMITQVKMQANVLQSVTSIASESKKINSFTRHDSIVFSISQENNAKNIISSVFKDFDFLYKIKYEEFNFQEGFLRLIDESDYVDFISADLDEVDFYSINNN